MEHGLRRYAFSGCRAAQTLFSATHINRSTAAALGLEQKALVVMCVCGGGGGGGGWDACVMHFAVRCHVAS